MHDIIWHRVRSVGLGAVALSLGLAGLLITSAAPGSAGAATQTAPSLDHFLCYDVKAKGFKPIKGLTIKNEIEPTPFSPTVGGVATHCNPATKTVQQLTGATTTYPARNPRAHLLCWSITTQTSPHAVRLTNQFGEATMTTSPGTKSLCLPTWMKRNGPPNKRPNQPPGLDHFTCYGLTELPGSYGFSIPPVVKVQDEFNAPKFTVIRVGTADTLCVPTTEVYKGNVYPPVTPQDLSLVCFPSSRTPYLKSFFDENQFGAGKVTPTSPATASTPFEELCLPSTVSLFVTGV